MPAGSLGAGANAGNVPLPEPNAFSTMPTAWSWLEVAGHRHDDVRRPVAIGPELADRVLGERPDARLVAADLAAERAVTEHRLLEQDLAVLGRVVQVAPDLLDDDLPLAVDLVRRERRPDDELAEDVHARDPSRAAASGPSRPSTRGPWRR